MQQKKKNSNKQHKLCLAISGILVKKVNADFKLLQDWLSFCRQSLSHKFKTAIFTWQSRLKNLSYIVHFLLRKQLYLSNNVVSDAFIINILVESLIFINKWKPAFYQSNISLKPCLLEPNNLAVFLKTYPNFLFSSQTNAAFAHTVSLYRTISMVFGIFNNFQLKSSWKRNNLWKSCNLLFSCHMPTGNLKPPSMFKYLRCLKTTDLQMFFLRNYKRCSMIYFLTWKFVKDG